MTNDAPGEDGRDDASRRRDDPMGDHDDARDGHDDAREDNEDATIGHDDPASESDDPATGPDDARAGPDDVRDDNEDAATDRDDATSEADEPTDGWTEASPEPVDADRSAAESSSGAGDAPPRSGDPGDSRRPVEGGPAGTDAPAETTGAREKGPDEKFCSSCGQVVNVQAELCPHCGVRQQEYIPSGGKDRVAAALFALLIGGLGAHKFYLGKTGQGLLYLCFFWTFIPAIVGFVEGLIYLTQSDEEFHRKHVA